MNSKKKWHVSGSETKSGRLDLSGTGNYYDRCYEFLSDDPRIYHFFTDRCRSKHEVCGSDLQ